jgi:hypothetical protein
MFSRVAHSNQFRMRGGITVRFTPIATASHHLAVDHHDRSHRGFALARRRSRFFKRERHPRLVDRN